MSILQIIKDLIGKQDINWGDSAAAFSRQTHSGGSISINYIDAECIPSTSKGGFVGDYLHEQNTDTGTNQANFILNNSANSLTLASTGLTAPRTYTFPDASQALAGLTELASTATSKGASLIGIEDAGGFFASSNIEGALTEIGQQLENQAILKGAKTGFLLGWLSNTSITIGGGMWHHEGSISQYVFLSAQISFILGSAGSNANSDDLSTDELHYIYLDNSAIASIGPSLTAACFKNKTSVPSYSHSKGGWYFGQDRCIGAILTNGSSHVVQFLLRDGYFAYQAAVEAFALGTPHTALTQLDLSPYLPVFCTRLLLSTSIDYSAATEADRHLMLSPTATGLENMGAVYRIEHLPVHVEAITANDQTLYWRLNDATGTQFAIHVAGFYTHSL